ncbi:hypothetical protein OG21DRAFT_1520484 [Imleria badia]|nr:hypothetical protein OG21DRAFT_1520484 [Imleria badia]
MGYTAIIRLPLGIAAKFDQKVFPVAYYEQDGDLNKGSFLIKVTLEEMENIGQLGIDLNENEDFIYNTRLNVEALKDQQDILQDKRKTLNPFKAFLNYRAARLFHTGTRALYLETKRTSEKIQREESRMRVVPSTQMRIVNDTVSPDEVIGGWAIELPNGLSDDAKRTIKDATETMATTDPFQDNFLVSQLRDGEQEITLADTASLLTQDEPERSSGVDEGNRTPVASIDLQPSRPTSPQTITVNFIQHSIVTSNSSLNGFTVNPEDRNSGASVTQEFAP